MITALGLGTKQAPENVNLDPQRQFWSWLRAFLHPDENGDSNAHQRAYFSGFACTQTSPAGMSIQIGGTNTPDSAVLVVAPAGKPVLLSTDGTPQTVTIPTAPASGSRIDAVVSYIDTTSADPEAETPGTPEYVHTIVVSGTASSSPSAPTNAQIVSALPAGAGGTYYRWCDVRVTANQTTITNSNITDRKPASPNLYWTTSDIEDIASDEAQSAVDKLADSLDDVTSTVVNPWEGVTLTLVKWTKLKLVVAYLGGRFPGQPVQSTISSAVIPSAYRPDRQARAAGFIGGVVATTAINADGTVFFWIPTIPGPNSEFAAGYAWHTSS